WQFPRTERRRAHQPAGAGARRGARLLRRRGRLTGPRGARGSPRSPAAQLPARGTMPGPVLTVPAMRLSRFHLHTTRETPADAEVASHRLMLRAGMIRRLAAGLYTWSPLGLRVLRRVAAIVREAMDAAGAIELLMPPVQPRELWEESGRWEDFGEQLLKLQDRKGAWSGVAPTHEEVSTDAARNELSSYKQRPVTYYQIQTKFGDEIRPRF